MSIEQTPAPRATKRPVTHERRLHREAQFWAKVSISADSSVCWPYRGRVWASGHGTYDAGKNAFGTKAAHRIAFFLANGLQTTEFMVRHLCGNACCCNPGHLTLGTQLENMQDRFVRHDDKPGPHPVPNPVPKPLGGWRIVTGDLAALERTALESEFWQNVDRSADKLSCWPWVGGSRHEFGYGACYWEGRHTSAHRVAYVIHHGLTLQTLGEEIVIRHLCPGGSNPACCNPAHLMGGTQQENMQDRAREGKYAKGEKHFAAKLSDADLVRMREEYWLMENAKKPTLEQLALRYGLTDWRHVHRLVHGDIRVEAGGPINDPDPDPRHQTQHARGERHPLARHPDSLIKSLREEYWGTPTRGRPSTIALGEKYGTDSKTVWNWLHGKSRMAAGGPIGN